MFIYVITHKDSGKAYVGQSKHAVYRIKSHIRTAETTRSLIARAIIKHGLDAFIVQIVKMPEGSTRELLNDIETRLIAHLGTLHPGGYNLRSGGNVAAMHPDSIEKIRQSKLGKPRTQECNAKISATLMACHPMRGVPFPEHMKQHLRDRFRGQTVSEAQKEKTRKTWERKRQEGTATGNWVPTLAQRMALGARMKGRIVSQEQRDAISQKLKGRKLSTETRARMSASRKGRVPHPNLLKSITGRRMPDEQRAKIGALKRERDALSLVFKEAIERAVDCLG